MKKWKLIINIVTFVALLVIIILARNDILRVIERLGDLTVGVLLLMIPMQFAVYFCYAKIFYFFFRATGSEVRMKDLWAPMIELNFVNHLFPSGGVSGFSYLTLRLKPYGISTARSTLAQLGRFAFIFVGYIVLLLIALFLLAAEGHTSGLVVLAVSAITFTMLFITLILLYIIGSQKRISAFSGTLTKLANRVIHIFRRKHPETISVARVEETFTELHEDYMLIRQAPKSMGRVALWAMITNLSEAGLLYLAFLAHGELVNPGAVLIAFVIASVAGLFALLPGGIGVYEPLMAAVLISAGVPAGLAVSATLVYRVVTLLLSLVTGYVLYQRAVQRYGTDLPSK